jgi:hypothetical protein
MESQASYIPKEGDLVLVSPLPASFIVVEVSDEGKTVNVEAVTGNIRVMRDVPWILLSQIDASELNARMQRLGQKPNTRYLAPRPKP